MTNNKLLVVLSLLFVFFLAGCGNTTTYSQALPANVVNVDFVVSVANKLAGDPNAGFGLNMGFVINNTMSPILTLKRGVTYSFSVYAPGHLFFITTNSLGGSTAGEITDGVTGSPVENGIMTFTANANHPSLLYYQCALHPYMGWQINIVN